MFSVVFWADTLEYNGYYADLDGQTLMGKGGGGGVSNSSAYWLMQANEADFLL